MEAVNEIKKEEADMASTSSDIVEIFSNIQETFTAELKIKEVKLHMCMTTWF